MDRLLELLAERGWVLHIQIANHSGVIIQGFFGVNRDDEVFDVQGRTFRDALKLALLEIATAESKWDVNLDDIAPEAQEAREL